MLAPIALFVYNRPDHFQQTLESLKKNTLAKDSTLFIFSDAPKNANTKLAVEKVRAILPEIKGFASIRVRERRINMGVARNVVEGLTEVLEEFPNVVVLEDDIVTSPNFLEFMNSALEFYENQEKVFSVTGYSYPEKARGRQQKDVFFSYRNSSWAWGIWRDRWSDIDWCPNLLSKKLRDWSWRAEVKHKAGADLVELLIAHQKGIIDSWAIRLWLSQYLQNRVTALSSVPLAGNIGNDKSGSHGGNINIFDVTINTEKKVFQFPSNIHVDEDSRQNMSNFFRSIGKRAMIREIRDRLLCLIKE